MDTIVDCEIKWRGYNCSMTKKTKVDAETKAALKRIDVLYHDLVKKLPAFPDFFMTVIMNGFGENVNLKQLYPDLYTRAENVAKDIIKTAARNPHSLKMKETNRLLPIYRYHLKTEMTKIPKRKN